jgi:hypothetical protein
MADSDISLKLFYDFHKNNFKIKTNLKGEMINEILSECYRATLNSKPDYRKPNKRDIYNINISLDLSCDDFLIFSNTGNNTLTYELLRESINNWELLPEETSVNKDDLEKIVFKNKN